MPAPVASSRARAAAAGSPTSTDLMRAVVHRHVQVAAGFARDLERALAAGAEREQCRARDVVARRRFGIGVVEPFAEGAQALVGVEVEHAPGDRGGVLAGAVADHGVRLAEQTAEQGMHRRVRGEHGLDGDVELHQPLPGQQAIFLGGVRPREGPVAQEVATRVAGVEAVDAVEDRPHGGEVQAEVGQHVRVLGAFAGEDEDELALAGERLGRVVDAGDRLDPLEAGLAELLDRLPELAAQVGQRVRHDPEPERPLGQPQLAAERECEIAQRAGETAVEGRREPLGLGEQVLLRIGLEDARLALPGRPVVGRRPAVELLEHGVGVDAAEPERVYAGAARLGASVDPGPRLGVDVEGRPLQAELRIRAPRSSTWEAARGGRARAPS